MPYVNIPETGLESSIARQVGKLKGQFESTVSTSIDSIKQDLSQGCPSNQKLQEIVNKLNAIKDLSTNIASRLNKIQKLIKPLENASTAMLGIPRVLKALPIPGIALTAGVTSTFSDLLHLVKEFGTQLKTSAQSIENILAQTNSLNNLLEKAADLRNRVDTVLEFCALSAETGIELDSTCISKIVSGTQSEAASCIRDFNDLLGSDVEAEGLLKDRLASALSENDTESYTGPDGTTYTIRVIEVQSQYTRAPRIQAIAENNQGIKKFESSSSFSSSKDVLKREVKFLIDNSQV